MFLAVIIVKTASCATDTEMNFTDAAGKEGFMSVCFVLLFSDIAHFAGSFLIIRRPDWKVRKRTV